LWRGTNPYCDPNCAGLDFDPDLAGYGAYYGALAYSPWYMFYFGFLVYTTAKVIIALDAAFWVVIMLDIGKPLPLILILHPTFLMLWAAANIDFVINGVGLWLILRGVRGWRMGLTLMLIAIKPQVLPFLLILEGLRVLWERDWQAVLVMVLIFGAAIVLYPEWLTETMPIYFTSEEGIEVNEDVTTLTYPFSVFGAWGIWAALGVTAVILLLMRHRLTEWRLLAIYLGLVWTPYVHPYSFAVLLILFRKAPAWRTLLYLALSLATLPFLFAEFHQYERYGTLVFLLLAVLLVPPDREQTEEAIAARRHQPVFPPARPVIRWQKTTV
jgi:hypothetical protein